MVTLYYLEEMGVGEIASVTGQAEGTVKNYLFRARGRLRQQLALSGRGWTGLFSERNLQRGAHLPE